MYIQHNSLAINTQRQLGIDKKEEAQSAEKLSSGYKINRSGDDVAGLKISEKLRAQIKGLNKGSDNVQDGISLLNVADGGYEEIHDILQRMNELAVQAANDTNTSGDRDALQEEVSALADEITRIGKQTTFNNYRVLDQIEGEEGTGTQLVACDAVASGHLTQSIQADDGKYHAAARLDFSNVTEKDIKKLAGEGFSFTCSAACEEVFEFRFKVDGTPSTAENLGRYDHHMYEVDISNCKDGTDVVNTLFDFVKANPPGEGSYKTDSNVISTAIKVSHSNDMVRQGSTLVIYKSGSGKNTAADAEKIFANSHSQYGAIDAVDLTNLTSDEDVVNKFKIQWGFKDEDYQIVKTHKTNAYLLRVDALSLKTFADASSAIEKIENAIKKVSDYRTELGTDTNRLEHTYKNVTCTAENIQQSESQLRDTNMAKEMIAFSQSSILVDASTSMLTQANQNSQHVLPMLQ